MKTKPFPKSAAVLLACLLATPTMGSWCLYTAESPFGPDSLTIDTRTGLNWLDLQYSVDLSYLQAEEAMQPGGPFAGFRHATAEEVASLYVSAGFQEGFITESSPEFQNIVDLVALVGTTSATGANGITGTPNGPDGVLLAYMNLLSQEGVWGYFVTANSPTTTYGLTTHTSTVGNWLVAVPEPSVCSLLLAGAAGGLALGRRRLK